DDLPARRLPERLMGGLVVARLAPGLRIELEPGLAVEHGDGNVLAEDGVTPLQHLLTIPPGLLALVVRHVVDHAHVDGLDRPPPPAFDRLEPPPDPGGELTEDAEQRVIAHRLEAGVLLALGPGLGAELDRVVQILDGAPEDYELLAPLGLVGGEPLVELMLE